MCAPALSLLLTSPLAAVPEIAQPDLTAASGIVWGVGLGGLVWAMLLYALLIA